MIFYTEKYFSQFLVCNPFFNFSLDNNEEIENITSKRLKTPKLNISDWEQIREPNTTDEKFLKQKRKVTLINRIHVHELYLLDNIIIKRMLKSM